MEHLHTDIAIIGGGPAGISAAIVAAEKGADVTLLEKADHTGGASNGGMGMFAVESRLQRQKHHKFSREDAYDFFMDFTRYRVDARLVKTYIDRSAGTIDWLEQRGIKFIDLIAYFPGAQFTWHLKDMQSPPIMETLTDLAKKLKVNILLEVPVKKIIMEDNKAVGLKAENKAGEDIQVNAKAMIIATGGFGDNPEMIREYTGFEWGKDLFSMRIPGLTGDGIRMAWEAGAAPTEMYMDTYSCLAPPYGGPGGTTFELAAFQEPILMVNHAGMRFINEDVSINVGMAANAIQTQKDGCAIRIMDEDTKILLEENALPGLDGIARKYDITPVIKKAMDEGYEHLFMADSLEELCEQANLPLSQLKETVDEYNRLCDLGSDEIFLKKSDYLWPVRRPPFYGARFFSGGYGSLGGIKINYKTEVLDKDFNTIPGLYAAGTDANAIYGDTYPFALSGNTSGFAYNTGIMAGENALAYIREE